MKSIIEILKSPNAVLGVLALALLAQMPHAADVFRLTVKGGNANIWTVVHSYSYAVALELAVLLFVVKNRHIESYGFAVVSVFVNLSYYGLHDVNLAYICAQNAAGVESVTTAGAKFTVEIDGTRYDDIELTQAEQKQVLAFIANRDF